MLLLSFTSAAATDMLPAWKDTPAKQAIEQWVQGATREGGADFIPLDKRYVVFDNDGTLWPEAPLTFQLQFAVDEVKRLAPEHPEWQKDPLVAAVLNNDLKTVAAGGEKGLLKLLALTHSGMTTEEFSQRVSTWFDSHQDKRTVVATTSWDISRCASCWTICAPMVLKRGSFPAVELTSCAWYRRKCTVSLRSRLSVRSRSANLV